MPNLTPTAFAIAKLSRKPPAFRWLWNNYDAVVLTLERRDAQKDWRAPVWQTMTDMAADAGFAVSRHALRQAWDTVCLEWAKADPALRVPLPGPKTAQGEPLTLTPKRVSAANEVDFFSNSGNEDTFSLPDITGKKI
jgi:hypothetical protein